MRVFVARSGQTFGPYEISQARDFLTAGQLQPNDYALFEGQTEWKFLSEILAAVPEAFPHGAAPESQEVLPESSSGVETTVGHSAVEASPQFAAKSDKRKVRKIQGAAKVQTVYVARKKGVVSRILSTIVVFSLMMILAVGGIVGAYFAMPAKMGPILKKFGVPMDQILASTPSLVQKEEVAVSSEPLAPDEIFLDADPFQTLRQSGMRILPLEDAKGLQIIAPADPPMEDKELETLLPIASHIVSMDLTNSKITDQGIASVLRLVNLKKLNLEGATEVTVSGVSKLKSLTKLEYLNLINVKLDDSIIDSLSTIESLREIYLFQTGISEEAIKKLKKERPMTFVNAG